MKVSFTLALSYLMASFALVVVEDSSWFSSSMPPRMVEAIMMEDIFPREVRLLRYFFWKLYMSN